MPQAGGGVGSIMAKRDPPWGTGPVSANAEFSRMRLFISQCPDVGNGCASNASRRARWRGPVFSGYRVARRNSRETSVASEEPLPALKADEQSNFAPAETSLGAFRLDGLYCFVLADPWSGRFTYLAKAPPTISARGRATFWSDQDRGIAFTSPNRIVFGFRGAEISSSANLRGALPRQVRVWPFERSSSCPVL